MPVRTRHFVVGGFINNGDGTINVTGVSGGLFDPTNTFAKYFNLTNVPVKQPVSAGDEITLEFPFTVPSALPYYPFAMQLIANVYYEDERGKYASVLVNSTVTFVDKAEPFDTSAWMPSVVTLAVIALFAYLFREAYPIDLRDEVDAPEVSAKGGSGPAKATKPRLEDESDEAQLSLALNKQSQKTPTKK